MKHLEKQNIQLGFDDMNWIQMKREKTQRQLSIPILPKAQEIIEKYLTDSNWIFRCKGRHDSATKYATHSGKRSPRFRCKGRHFTLDLTLLTD
jgi:integrase